jgi:uncharacterized Zn-binding protein involved in type VI secretion
MAGVACAGVDSAGGVINGGGQSFVTVNGAPMAVVGDGVAGHGSGSHASAVLVQGSSILTINGVPVVLAGMRASCNDQATGRPNVTCSA